MGYSTRVAERRGRVHADANGDTPNALAKQQSFCAGLDHQCDDGDSEGISTVKGPEDSSRSVPEGGRASRWNSRDKIAEPPMDELAILSESQQIAQIGSWWRSPSGPAWWSAEMYRLYGVSPDTPPPSMEGLLAIIHSEDRRAFQVWFSAAAAGDGRDPLEFRVLRPNGSVRWLLGRCTLKNAGPGAPVFVAGTAQDITERKRLEDTLTAALDYNRMLIELCPSGVIVFKATGEFVSTNEATAKIIGGSIDVIRKQNFRTLESWKRSGLLTSVDNSLDTNNIVETDIHFNPTSFGKESWISARIVPFVFNSERHILGLLSDITDKKAIEDQNRAHLAKLEAAFMQTVEAITALSEMRDPYTAGHERRVAEIAVAIGAELRFDADRQQGLRVAGHLHDVGKINIPGEILSKPGKLRPAELTLVQEHAQAGYNVLKNIEFPWPVALVALQHHERIDGSGYPQGLKGDEIIWEARIIAVADVVEAMASHRPYRPAVGIEKALAEIERGRGTAFDADVADACLRLFRERGYQLPA